MLETPPANFSQQKWTAKLQNYEKTWEQQKWGAQDGETWSTVGTPVAVIKAARQKYAAYL